MRSSVWVVLGLVGLAPAGALAQAQQRSGQAGRASAVSAPADEAQDDTNQPIIVEMPATGQRRASSTAVSRPHRGSQPGTGGSGMSGMARGQADQPSATNVEVFQGTLRSVEGDRLWMADANGNVYQFGLGQRARIVGPDGADISRQGLREGLPVRTVTQPGAIENEVVTLQVFTPPAAPSR